LSSDKIVIANS